jgi:hypothetical protein
MSGWDTAESMRYEAGLQPFNSRAKSLPWALPKAAMNRAVGAEDTTNNSFSHPLNPRPPFMIGSMSPFPFPCISSIPWFPPLSPYRPVGATDQPTLSFEFRTLSFKLPLPVSPQNKRRLCYTLAILFLLGAVLLWSRSGPSELDRYKAQLIAQGEILDVDKLAPKRTGLETNGLEFLLSISNNLTPWVHTNHFYDHSWQPSGSGQLQLTFPRAFSPTNRAANWRTLEALINSNRVDIAIIRYAFEHGTPPKDLGLDYRLGLDYPNANPVLARRFAPLLSISTIADIHAHAHPNESFASLTGLLGLTDYLAEEQTFSLQYQRFRFIEQARLATWYALETHAWDEAKLSQLQAKWMAVSILTNTYQALLMNRAQIGTLFTIARHDRDKLDDALIPYYTYYPPTHADHKLWEWWWYRFGIDADEPRSTSGDKCCGTRIGPMEYPRFGKLKRAGKMNWTVTPIKPNATASPTGRESFAPKTSGI